MRFLLEYNLLIGKSFDAISHSPFGYAIPYHHHHHHPNGSIGAVPMVSHSVYLTSSKAIFLAF